jgi:hypothetical protein
MDIVVHDFNTGTTEHISVTSLGKQINKDSFTSALSASGRYVAFLSYSSRLIPNAKVLATFYTPLAAYRQADW